MEEPRQDDNAVDAEEENIGNVSHSGAINELSDLLTHLCKHLVDDESAINIDHEEESSGITFYLNVADDDLGKVIGKRGKTATAIRALLSAAATKKGVRALLSIED